ncbi:MAG TPA: rhodanese-like domain-containing protein [Draconibacterium sp.]|nr:rhodanese-like domain-containing protein [Draconibacterium sp.]
MHKNKLNPWRTLITLSIFIVILIAGFFTMNRPLLTYSLDVGQSIEEFRQNDAYFYPWQLDSFINKQNQKVALFDIRDNFVYGQGNITGSENVSAHNLTLAENIERLEKLNKQGVTVVLYGKDQLQANGPCMLFRQVGFNNVKVLVGGYDYYIQHKDNLAACKTDSTLINEIPRYNFAERATQKGNSDVSSQSTEKKPVVVRKKVQAAASGGC